MSVACPNENELLARVERTLPLERAAEVDAHVDSCSSCRILLAEAASDQSDPRGRGYGSATFEAGEVIAERYIVTRWIASGGMGEVYEVHDRSLDEQIALKTVIATIADDEYALARLKAEVRMARRVTHENVCRVYDLGTHQREGEQIAFLTMELLRGTTLRQRLHDSGPIDVETALPIVAQMVAALGHAHAAGIVHRDFKSENVMLVRRKNEHAERVVVMDFGLARQSLVAGAQPLTPHSRTVFGTLDYMSPEQVAGKPASTASDIYSLGVVVYELLTGRLPFEGDSPLARALLRVTENAPALTGLLPQVDRAVNDCIAKCLQKMPDRRFESAGQVLQAMQGDRRALVASHRPTISVVVAAVLGIALGFVASSSLRSTRAEQSVAQQPAAPIPKVDRAIAARPASNVEAVRGAPPPAVATPEIATGNSDRPGRGIKKRATLALASDGKKHELEPHLEAIPPPRTESRPVPSGDALLNPFSSHPGE